MGDESALYVRDGDAFVGTVATKGSWHDNGQAGGAVLALLGHVLEDVPTLTPMSITRLTVDIVRPVPVGEPLWIDTEVRREGKKIQVVDLSVRTAEAEHGLARALRIREDDLRPLEADMPTSTSEVDPAAALPRPDELESVEHHPGVAKFLCIGAELRRTYEPVSGYFGAWIRLRVPVVEAEPVRPASRAAIPMDMVNLIGVNSLRSGKATIINADVSAHVLRVPDGEWIGLSGNTYFDLVTGHGMSTASMSDEHGVFGVASTSQIVQPRGD